MRKDKIRPAALDVPATLNLLLLLLVAFLSGCLLHDSLFLKEKEATDVQIGPWGGKGGSGPWIFVPDGRLSQIHISTGECVDYISFTYSDHAGVNHYSERYGGHGGRRQTVPSIVDALSGTVGEFGGDTVITSLSFQTDKRAYGPYGRNEGTSTFSLQVSKGRFGRFSGEYGLYLNSFGVILHSF